MKPKLNPDNVQLIKLEDDDSLKRRVLGDQHFFETGHEEEALAAAIKGARDEERKLINLGDTATFILQGDRRFNVEEHGESYEDQRATVKSYVANTKDITEIMHKGNHGDTVSKSLGDALKKICEEEEVPNIYCGFQMNTKYKKNGNSFWLYTHHGFGSMNYRAGEDIRKPINRRVRIKDLFRATKIEADLYIMGHHHFGDFYSDPYQLRLVNRDGLRYWQEYRPIGEGKIYGVNPSFVRTYYSGENYAAKWGLSASEIGYTDFAWDKKLNLIEYKIMIWNDERKEFFEKDSLERRKIDSGMI